jgi:hypothetical protein
MDWLFCGLFKDAIGSANYIVLKHRVNGQLLIGSNMEVIMAQS